MPTPPVFTIVNKIKFPLPKLNKSGFEAIPMPPNSRRAFIATAIGSIPTMVVGRPQRLPKECKWILGTWRSNAAMSMANFTFQGKRPNPEALQKIGKIFGNLSHTFNLTQFIVEDESGRERYREDYFVERFTSSSVSLGFLTSYKIPSFTIYRGEGYYLTRAEKNFEYFKKI